MFVKMDKATAGSSVTIGRGVTIVDSSITDCAAWVWAKSTRERALRGSGATPTLIKLTDHSELFHYVIDLVIPGFQKREWLTRAVWKTQEDGSFLVAYEGVGAVGRFNSSRRSIDVSPLLALWKLEKLPPRGDVPQTKVIVYTDPHALIPKAFLGTAIVGQLVTLSCLRRKFDRSLEVDQARRAELIPVIQRMPFDAEESEAIKAQIRFNELFEERKGSKESKSGLGSAKSRAKVEKASRSTWGQTSVVVRADLEEVAAALWLFDSRSNFEISGDVERKFQVEGDNGKDDRFEATVERRQTMENSFGQRRDRLFTSNVHMHKIEADSIVILKTAVAAQKGLARRAALINKRGRKSTRRGDIEAKETVAVMLRSKRKGHTELDLAVELDLGGSVSSEARLKMINMRLDEAGKVSIYFQRRVRLEDMAKEDGEALAYDVLFSSNSAKQRVERLPEVLERSAALAELKAKYVAFEPMMRSFLSGRLALKRAVDTKLVCTSDKDGDQLGKNGVMAVKAKKLVAAGINDFRLQNVAVNELFEIYPFLQPAFTNMAREVVRTAPWGLRWRVSVGALLSILTLATDINVTLAFYEKGQTGYFHAMLAR